MIEFILIVAALLTALGIRAASDERLETKKRIESYREDFGKQGINHYSEKDIERMMVYHTRNAGELAVDDITWNDLGMEELLSRLDTCKTFYGQEMLYHILRNPLKNIAILQERDRVIRALTNDEQLRLALSESLYQIGKASAGPLCQLLEELRTLKERGTTQIRKDVFCLVLGIVSMVLIFAMPVAGFAAFFIILFFNLIVYFKRKKEISDYIKCFCEILRLIYNCEKLDMSSWDKELGQYKELINSNTSDLKSFTRGAILLTAGHNATGNLFDLVLDYFRMFLHLDIIKFYLMLDEAVAKSSSILELSETIGLMDASLAIAGYRASLKESCVPEFGNEGYSVSGLYHPLVSECVANDIETKQGVMLTGTNASGKSTFLRSTALAAVMAQTIYSVCAKSYKADIFRVATSMSLSDDVLSGDSYYIAEIKSIKRILEYAEADSVRLLCVIDEVLRGTNTAERIAASREILLSLRKSSVCFAATHDLELAGMLDKDFDNYHFTENIDLDKESIVFTYKIEKGITETRNAILLLHLMGYDDAIVDNAAKRCVDFLKKGRWE